MILLIDQNEQATNPNIVKALLKEYPGAAIFQLIAGDVNVTTPQGLLAIERKAPGDLLNSIADNRLFDQVERMLRHAKFAALIVHGSLLYNRDDYVVADGQERKWTGVSIRAALRTCQLAGCIVEIVKRQHYVRAVGEIIATVSKESHVHYSKPAITLETLDPRAQFLSLIPGVGPKRAQDWLQWSEDRLCDALHYGSLFLDMETSSLPRNFGPKTSQSIRDFLQLEEGEFLQTHQSDRSESNGPNTE